MVDDAGICCREARNHHEQKSRLRYFIYLSVLRFKKIIKKFEIHSIPVLPPGTVSVLIRA